MDRAGETAADHGRTLHQRVSTVLTLPLKVLGFGGICFCAYVWARAALSPSGTSQDPLWANVLGFVLLGYLTVLSVFLMRLKGVTICDDGVEVEGLFKRRHLSFGRITAISAFKHLGMALLLRWPVRITVVGPDGRKRKGYFLLRLAIPTGPKHPDVILLKALTAARGRIPGNNCQ